MSAKRKKPVPMRTVSVVLTYEIKVSEVEVPADASDHEAALIAEEFIHGNEWNLVDWEVSE